MFQFSADLAVVSAMRITLLSLVLVIAVAASSASVMPRAPQRIVGGSVTTINQYPFGAALLSSLFGTSFTQSCGATILNIRCVLTAAHCFIFFPSAGQWRVRVGSTWANSGGTVLNTAQIIRHPNYVASISDNDVAILRLSSNINMVSNTVAPVQIAGANYNLADNQVVWAIGWGRTSFGGPVSEQLRHVQVWTINQNVCAQRYTELGRTVTANMLCSGWLDVGGRDQCQGDSGGPLLHNNVQVGVCSWGEDCAHPRYPGVNARISRFSNWIVANA